MTATTAPNHHGDHGTMSGAGGLLAGLTMTVGRGGTARFAARLTDVQPGDHVVDVGCGPGTAARHGARLGARVTGVDPAPVMLGLARWLTRSTPTVEFVEGAAEALPLPDDVASVVWSISCVHHWRDLAAGLREVRRVLEAGGRLLAIERQTQPGARGHASHGWTEVQAAAFAEACRAAGFQRVLVEQHAGHRRGGLCAVLATVG